MLPSSITFIIKKVFIHDFSQLCSFLLDYCFGLYSFLVSFLNKFSNNRAWHRCVFIHSGLPVWFRPVTVYAPFCQSYVLFCLSASNLIWKFYQLYGWNRAILNLYLSRWSSLLAMILQSYRLLRVKNEQKLINTYL